MRDVDWKDTVDFGHIFLSNSHLFFNLPMILFSSKLRILKFSAVGNRIVNNSDPHNYLFLKMVSISNQSFFICFLYQLHGISGI
jgi:hypothetical protein